MADYSILSVRFDTPQPRGIGIQELEVVSCPWLLILQAGLVDGTVDVYSPRGVRFTRNAMYVWFVLLL